MKSNMLLKIPITILLVCCCVLPVTATPKQSEFVLVDNGKPKATLVLAARPRQAAKFAAADFQHYLEKMTGVRLPESTDEQGVIGPKVLIGESQYTVQLGYRNKDFEPDEYIVKTGPDYLLIMGRDRDSYGPISYTEGPIYSDYHTSHDISTIYGVNDFLKKQCGIRWYLPGEIGEVVPRRKTLRVGRINYRRRPWARLRLYRNAWIPKKLYWWGGLKPMTKNDILNPWDSNGSMRWFLHMNMRNEPFSATHNYGEFYQRFHKTHPDYFAHGYPLKPGIQPNFASPDVVSEVVKLAQEYFQRPKEKQYFGDCFPVSPMDNANWSLDPCSQTYFSGPRPSKFWSGYSSRYIWTFVNKVAREVQKTNPNKWISCFAYWDYLSLPEDMALESNVAVHVCRPLACTWRPDYAREFEQAFAAWGKASRRIYLYDYSCFPKTPGKFKVFPMIAPRRIAADLKKRKAMGLRGAYDDIDVKRVGGALVWPNVIADQINAYIWFTYLDDQSRPVEEILEEFYTLFYGPAGKHIQSFVEKTESIYWDRSRWTKLIQQQAEHLDEKTSWESLCPPETLRVFEKIIAAAHAAAKTPLQKKRVELFDNAVYQMMKTSSDHFFEQEQEVSEDNSLPLPERWNFLPDPERKGLEKRYFDADFDDRSWKSVSTWKVLEKQGYEDYQSGWYRMRIALPEQLSGYRIILRLGAVDETCWVWVNGRPAGEFVFNPTLNPLSWIEPLRFDITKLTVAGKENQITVQIQNIGGNGGIWKPSHIVYKPKNWNPDWCTVISSP